MKIAILAHMFLPHIGGAEIFAYNITNELRSIGNTVDVYIPARNFHDLGNRFPEGLIPLPRKFFGLLHDMPLIGRPRVSYYLNQWQSRESYDLWAAVGTYPSGTAVTSLKGKVPNVLISSGADIQVNPEIGYGARLNKKVNDRVNRSVKLHDKVVVTAETVRSDFLQLGVENENVATIPRGVDIDWFQQRKNIPEVRAALGWPLDRPVILTTGRNHPKKGFHHIPKIASILRKEGLQFNWYVVGKGTDQLDQEIQRMGLSDCLITRDQIGVSDSGQAEWRFPNEALVSMYQAADIYAFPSLLESFGIVQIEAMAAGIPVVSTDAPGCREVVINEVSGLQAKAGDPESFARCVSMLLKSAEYRNRLSQSASKFVKDYGWSNIARQYHELFVELLEANKNVSAAYSV